MRKIIHIDMDAFFASIEQRDNPDLQGKPVAVGGNSQRGVVAAASYEARKFGVHSAMPSARAAKLCPNLIFVKHRFDVYREASYIIRSIFQSYTDLVEPLSLDEAYLDVTHVKKGPPSATLIARAIKQEIKAQTQLTASAGVSYNKFLAKTASDVDKPDGLFVILPEQADEFLATLPIRKFYGIGKVTAEKMKTAGIFRGEDLRKISLEDMIRRYGKAGDYYYHICRGIDQREVKPHRERKSVSAERTFSKELMRLEEVNEKLAPIIDEVWKRYTKGNAKGKTIVLKVKYGDFRQITKSHTDPEVIDTQEQFQNSVNALLTTSLLNEEGIRLLGVGISNFQQEQKDQDLQLTLKL